MNRTRYSVINSMVSSGTQALNILSKFVVQTIFIRELGATYLGVNGLFTNVLSILSFAELGIGNAIIFSLYEPLAKNNHKTIASIMRLYQRAYRVIGILIAVVGVVFIPFIHFFINGQQSVPFLEGYYLLFLGNTVMSYFFTYKRSLLIADQRGYISVLNQFAFTVIQAIGQIWILMEYQNFALYLIIQILCTVISNVLISHVVDKRYPYIEALSVERVPPRILTTIVQNTRGMMGSKIGSIAINSTDNLLISMFMGLKTVGIYSNYFLIFNSATAVLNQLINSVSSSIGNLVVTSSEKIEDVFFRHNFINFVFTLYATTIIFSLVNPFIQLWVGVKYQLSTWLVFLLSLNFMFNQLRQTNLTFISSYGLFDKIGRKSVLEAIINVVVSLTFLSFFHLGIEGVILGNILSNLMINVWYEPLVVFRYGLKAKKLRHYYRVYLGDVFYISVNLVPLYFLNVTMTNNLGIYQFVLYALAVVAYISLFLVVFKHRNHGFKYMLYILGRIVGKK